jgi:hypothetical protein
MRHNHWHISYKVPAGYCVLDNVPFTSKQACENGITALPWSKGENPEPHQVSAPHCPGGCF